MANRRKSASLLICDSDTHFLQSLGSDSHAGQGPPMLTSTGKEAQLLIADDTNEIAGVFVSANVVGEGLGPGWISVLRSVHQHRLATPVFFLADKGAPPPDENLDNLGVQKTIYKPVSYPEIAKLVLPERINFDPASLPDQEGKSDEILNKEMSAEDDLFVPIRASTFIAGTKSFFDVYLRLLSGRYIKLLQIGDNFSAERIESYLKKGTSHFYLKKTAQAQYLDFCDQLTAQLIQSDNVSGQILVSRTLSQGEETLSFLRNYGISPQGMQYASAFVGNVNAMVGKLQLEKNQTINSFLHDIAAADHGSAAVIVSGLLAKHLGITSDYATEVVGIAALLHDVGLYRLLPGVQGEDETQMTSAQKLIFQTHPIGGAKIMAGIQQLNQAVLQAVTQHHERRDETGFPSHLGQGSINRIAEIVGISDEIIRAIGRLKDKPDSTLEKEMKPSLVGFPAAIVEAFQMVFFSAKYRGKAKS